MRWIIICALILSLASCGKPKPIPQPKTLQERLVEAKTPEEKAEIERQIKADEEATARSLADAKERARKRRDAEKRAMAEEAKSGRAPLVKVFTTSTHLTIQSKEATAWSGGTVFINGQPPFTYHYNLPTIQPDDSISIPLMEFIKKDGERFNPYQRKVVQVWVGGGGFSYGGFGF